MDFSEKYISAENAKIDLTSQKVPISNDAYAVGEMIQELIKIILSRVQ